MSAMLSANGGTLKENSAASTTSIFGVFALALVLLLALAPIASFPHSAQSSTNSSPSLGEFVGTYKQQSSEKRLRVVEKDRHLVCETADGSALVTFHLLQAPANDVFEITKTSTRQQVKFLRNSSGKITGLTFAGDS
jgi:hypothetical protein